MNIHEAKRLNENYKYITIMAKISSIQNDIVTAIQNQRGFVDVIGLNPEFVEVIKTHFEEQGFTCKYDDGSKYRNAMSKFFLWDVNATNTLTIRGWKDD